MTGYLTRLSDRPPKVAAVFAFARDGQFQACTRAFRRLGCALETLGFFPDAGLVLACEGLRSDVAIVPLKAPSWAGFVPIRSNA